MHSKVFVYRNCRKQTEWGLCRLTSQITPLSDISYKQIGSPPPLKQLLRVSILLPQCKSVLSSNCFFCVVLRKKLQPLKGNVKGQCGLKISWVLLRGSTRSTRVVVFCSFGSSSFLETGGSSSDIDSSLWRLLVRKKKMYY